MKQTFLLLIFSVYFFTTTKSQTWSSGIGGVNDTTISGYKTIYDMKQCCEYTIDKEHYRDAIVAIQLSEIPFNGLNDAAKKELMQKSKYIKSMRIIQCDAETKRSKQNK